MPLYTFTKVPLGFPAWDIHIFSLPRVSDCPHGNGRASFPLLTSATGVPFDLEVFAHLKDVNGISLWFQFVVFRLQMKLSPVLCLWTTYIVPFLWHTCSGFLLIIFLGGALVLIFLICRFLYIFWALIFCPFCLLQISFPFFLTCLLSPFPPFFDVFWWAEAFNF